MGMSTSRQEKVVNGRRPRPGPAPARVEGPLAGYEPALRAELAEMGYASATVRDVVAAMRRLSAWMARRRVAAANLTPSRVEEFLAARRRVTSLELVARRGLGPLLRFLRGRGLIPRDGVGDSPVETLLADYRDWLVEQRGLSGETVRCYLVQGRKLLTWLGEPLPDSLRRLDASRPQVPPRPVVVAQQVGHKTAVEQRLEQGSRRELMIGPPVG
jgi:integrase/recombinase XerD